MSDELNIEIEQSACDGNWCRLKVEKVSLHVERRKGNTTREAWVSFVPETGMKLTVAFEEHPGAGPLPEGTIRVITLGDMLKNALTELQDTILFAEDKEEEGEW